MHRFGTPVSNGEFHLPRLLDPGTGEQLGVDVVAANEVTRREIGAELGVVDDHADVAQAVRARGQLVGEPLARAVEAVVVADLHHAAGRVAGSDDRVGVLQVIASGFSTNTCNPRAARRM